MTAPPTRLLSAVLQSLSEVGPCPTAFRASPGADYVCNGKPMQAGPGWWVAFACQLQIVSVSDAGTSDEVVVLRFQGDRVHRGEAFSWELATTTDQLGQRRLLLEDTATYPDPLLNILAYRAIAECRDMLLQRTALRLGQILPEKPGLKTVVTTCSDAPSGSSASSSLYRSSRSNGTKKLTEKPPIGGQGRSRSPGSEAP